MTNTAPVRLSVGLPVYNGEAYLEAAIASLLEQTYTDFELIISDNASCDRTEAICREYAARDSRIRYYRAEQNQGAGWNFNRVFELATGEYFRWACHDDLCEPHLFEHCLAVLEREPEVVVCYPRSVIINEHGQRLADCDDGFHFCQDSPPERFWQYLQTVRHGHGCHPLYGIMRRNILQTLLPLGSYPSSDLVLLGQLTLFGKFYEVPGRFFLKRDHPQTSVRAHRAFRDRIAWYDPSKQGKLHLTRWKWLREYRRALHLAPLTRRETLHGYWLLGHWLGWNWPWLAKDLAKAAAWPLVSYALSLEAIWKTQPSGDRALES